MQVARFLLFLYKPENCQWAEPDIMHALIWKISGAMKHTKTEILTEPKKYSWAIYSSWGFFFFQVYGNFFLYRTRMTCQLSLLKTNPDICNNICNYDWMQKATRDHFRMRHKLNQQGDDEAETSSRRAPTESCNPPGFEPLQPYPPALNLPFISFLNPQSSQHTRPTSHPSLIPSVIQINYHLYHTNDVVSVSETLDLFSQKENWILHLEVQYSTQIRV